MFNPDEVLALIKKNDVAPTSRAQIRTFLESLNAHEAYCKEFVTRHFLTLWNYNHQWILNIATGFHYTRVFHYMIMTASHKKLIANTLPSQSWISMIDAIVKNRKGTIEIHRQDMLATLYSVKLSKNQKSHLKKMEIESEKARNVALKNQPAQKSKTLPDKKTTYPRSGFFSILSKIPLRLFSFLMKPIAP